MYKFFFLSVGSLSLISGKPLNLVKTIAEEYHFNDVDNYLPKFDDVINYPYSINSFEDADFLVQGQNVTNDGHTKITRKKPKTENVLNETNTTNTEPLRIAENRTSVFTNMKGKENITVDNAIFVEFEGNSSSEGSESNRQPRQELNETRSDPEFESQEEESSEEEGNMVTGLISAFLGGLSKPDGSIDLEAIVGLLGSLSTQNDDGSYDFQGLTELLKGFFGGGDDGGGSDIGAFIGGLLGAVIKGIAPGAKAAGKFAGKVVAGVLPALSAPPPNDGMENKPQGSDSGGFLAGLIKTILSSSSGGNAEGGGSGSNLFKIIFQLITSLLAASSKSH